MFETDKKENTVYICSENWHLVNADELIKKVKEIYDELPLDGGIVYVGGHLIYRDTTEKDVKTALTNLTNEEIIPYWMD